MKHLAEIVNSFSNKRIVVIGDLIADQFIYGEISRVSREAPVFILRHEHTETTPGGAGNCAMNPAALCPEVQLNSLLVDDGNVRTMQDKMCAARTYRADLMQSSVKLKTTNIVVLPAPLTTIRQ